MSLASKIKQYRVFSITVTFITLYWVYEALQYIYPLLSNPNLTTQQAGLATTTLATLVALIKFSYTFAVCGGNKDATT